MDGRRIYVRLSSLIGGTFQYDDCQYIALTAARGTLTRVDPPTSPAGAGVSDYSFDYVCSGHDRSSGYVSTNGQTSATISGIPHQGVGIITVYLGSLISGTWYESSSTYQVWDGLNRSVMKLPVPGTQLDISASSTIFKWTPTDTAASYQLEFHGNNQQWLYSKPVPAGSAGQDVSTSVAMNFVPAGTSNLDVWLTPQGVSPNTTVRL